MIISQGVKVSNLIVSTFLKYQISKFPKLMVLSIQVPHVSSFQNELHNICCLLSTQMSCCGVNAVTGTTNDFDTSAWITSSSAGSKHIPRSCCSGVTSATYSTYTNTACTDSVTSGYHTKVMIFELLLDLVQLVYLFVERFFKNTTYHFLKFLKGCYDAIYNSLSAYYIIFIAVGVTVMVIEVLFKRIPSILFDSQQTNEILSQSINAYYYIKHC